MIEDVKGFIGKPILELTAKLNKEKRKYRILKPKTAGDTQYMLNRLTISVDENNTVTRITTG